MQELGSLGAAGQGTGTLLSWVPLCFEGCGESAIPGSMILYWDVRAMRLRILPSFFKDVDGLFVRPCFLDWLKGLNATTIMPSKHSACHMTGAEQRVE